MNLINVLNSFGSRINSGGRLITGVVDNWDHNEHSIGERNTHAMTSILLQSTSDTARDPEQCIQRATKRSFGHKQIEKLVTYYVLPLFHNHWSSVFDRKSNTDSSDNMSDIVPQMEI